jgi:hypothetical protein
MPKKSAEDIRLIVAQMLNEENDSYSHLIKSLNIYAHLTATQQLIETLNFAHKAKVELLERLYKEI